MSDQPAPPPPPPSSGQPAWQPPQQSPQPAATARTWKTWQLVVAAIVALVIGMGLGAAGSEDGTEALAANDTAEQVADLEAEIDRLEGELADRDEALAAAAESEAQSPESEPTDEPEAETPEPDATSEPDAEPAEQDGTYAVGDYTFADVQVSEDFIGDFEVRARMTNNGADKGSVGIKATLFSAGSVVGTADGIINNVDAGATMTVEMISTDEFAEWDAIEFQIQFEF